MIICGDSLVELKKIEDNYFDSVVTDPPYGISFMNKKWDYDVPSVELWREVLRVLKPGGHVLSFGGTRTYHRMVVNMEDAGFEIRDQIMWIYGSGFPKSHDVSKGIDKAAGAEREVIGTKTEHNIKSGNGNATRLHNSSGNRETIELPITAPSTDLAKQWQGWGTALKPANEPICLARKPLDGTVAANVEAFGTGGLNIDASRIATSDNLNGGAYSPGIRKRNESAFGGGVGGGVMSGANTDFVQPQGRWPANVLFDEEAAAVLDAQTAEKSPTSRFFYVAKASKRERNAGLEGMPSKVVSVWGGDEDDLSEGKKSTIPRQNHHPTVKPVKLMEYLVRLVTPPGGTVLDPFMGSGTTGVACEGFGFVGIEKNEEYFKIADKRIEIAGL